jgi:hypothetical protein
VSSRGAALTLKLDGRHDQYTTCGSVKAQVGKMRSRTIVVRPIIATPKEAKKPRDFVAISLSVLSLAISCLGFYFSTLLQTDDIRLVIDEVPSVWIDDGSLVMPSVVKLTLVNSGNRAAAVSSINATARKVGTEEGADPKCEGERLNIFGLGIEPFVLKPGEIMSVQSKQISGFGVSAQNKEGRQIYVMQKWLYTPEAYDELLVCISITMVTPDDYIKASRTKIYKYTVVEDWRLDKWDEELEEKKEPDIVRELYSRSQELFDKSRPIRLFGQSRWLDKLKSAFGLKN